VPAIPSSIIEPVWDQFSALLPPHPDAHPLGCHRPRIPDRVVFDKLVQVLVFGCAYWRIADDDCSATTLRRRRDEWIAAGVLDHLASVVEAYVDLVWRYVMSRLSDPHRAADATSVSFQKALAALPNFQPQRRGDETTFRCWLMTIARNVVIDQTRRDRPTTALDDPAAQRWLIDTRRGPEDHAIADDERRRIDRALAELPDAQRQVVELRLIGMKGAEIAGLLGMTESAVKTAYHRACSRLRDLLSEPGDGGSPR